MRSSEFVTYVIADQLAGMPGISARAMFGGFGIYREGVIVGIVVDDELYLRADPATVAEYRKMGSTPFSYERRTSGKKKRITMSYWKIPLDVLEDKVRLSLLVDRAHACALHYATSPAGRATTRKRNPTTL